MLVYSRQLLLCRLDHQLIDRLPQVTTTSKQLFYVFIYILFYIFIYYILFYI